MMRVRSGLRAALVLVALFTSSNLGAAQDADLTGLQASDFLPLAGELGPDWELANRGQLPDDDADVGAVQLAQFVGPGGSRSWLIAAEVGSGPGATWQVIRQGLFAYLKQQIDDEYLAEGTSRRIDGCDEAVYASGTEVFYGSTIGITQCAVGNQFVLVAMVSGSLQGLSGSGASRALISTSLDHAGVTSPDATPTP